MRTAIAQTVALASLALGLVLATCAEPTTGAGGAGRGDARVNVTPSGGAEQAFNHDPQKSRVVATPPAGGLFVASFEHPEPPLRLEMRINGERVREGDTIRLPLGAGTSGEDFRLTVEHAGKTYGSDQAGVGGEVKLDVLVVTETSVDIRSTFNVVLGEKAGAGTLTAVGFLEAHQGDTQSELDAGF